MTLATKEYHTPEGEPATTAFLADRDLETHGFFLTSYLERGFDVLDVGCGPGTISAGIASAVFPGQVTAVDISPSQLEYGRRLSQGLELVNLHFVEGSAYQLPFEDEAFDLVFSHALLEHLQSPVMALREFYRLTRPGGFAVVCSPDWDELEMQPFPTRVQDAIHACRMLHRSSGGTPQAGSLLTTWLEEAGFMVLAADEWREEHPCARQVGDYLADQLEAAGKMSHAHTLRRWAGSPEARFCQAWKYAGGVRMAD